MNTGKSKKVPEMALFLLQKFLKIYIIYLQNIKSKSTAKANLLYFSQHQSKLNDSISPDTESKQSKHRTQKPVKTRGRSPRVFCLQKINKKYIILLYP